MLPYVKASFYLLKNRIGLENIDFVFEIEKNIPVEYAIPLNPRLRNRKNFKKLNKFQQLAVAALEERLTLEFKSYSTIKTYRNILKGLLFHFPKTKPSSITSKQINKYIIYKRRESRISASYMNQIINTFNAFFGRVLGQEEKVIQLKRPKKDRKMPNFISADEMKKLLTSCENSKHKAMLILIYSAGLRKNELLNLRIRDLNKSTKCIFVKGGKGRKDRYTLYSPSAIRHVEKYLQEHNPSHWLFEGQTKGKYSATSLQLVFEKAKEISGVNKRLTIHGIRHSFATHLAYKRVPLHEIKNCWATNPLKPPKCTFTLRTATRVKSKVH